MKNIKLKLECLESWKKQFKKPDQPNINARKITRDKVRPK